MRILKISQLVFILSVTSSGQWYEKPDGLPDTCYAYAIDAVDSLIATGLFSTTSNHKPDSIYFTTTGGNIWYSRSLPYDLLSYEYIYDISIKDENKIWFCTGEGKIYNTNNGGFDWQLQFYDTSMTKFMNYIEMFDSLNGIAMGDAPANDKPALFLKTTNGGNNWISQNLSFFLGESNVSIWRTVDFINTNRGYFILFNGPLYKTTNSGGFWWSITSYQNMRIIKAFDADLLLGVDQYILHRTTDGGQSWESNQSNLLEFGFDIEFIPGSPEKVWYISSAVCYSSDTGRTWQEEFRLADYSFMDIVFTEESSGWLLANSNAYPNPAKIFRTANGGHGGIVSIDDNSSDINPKGYSLEQNYPNPFNPVTKIKFTIPTSPLNPSPYQGGGNRERLTTLKVYDVLGNEIAILCKRRKTCRRI